MTYLDPTVDGRNPVNSPVEEMVVNIPLFSGFFVTFQVILWDF